MFLNLKNGKLSINTYRFINAVVTTVEDILDCANTNQVLTATINTQQEWIDLRFLTDKST